MSNELWNLHCTRSNDEESDFDSVTEWASSYILSLERRLAECQAREVVLRDALNDVLANATVHFPEHMIWSIESALAMPHDSNSNTLEIPDVIRERRWRREALLEAADYLLKRGYQGNGFELSHDLRRMALEDHPMNQTP